MPALRPYAAPPERRKSERRKFDRRKIQREQYLIYKEDQKNNRPYTKGDPHDADNTQGKPKHS